MKEAEQLLTELTLAEKAAIVAGTDFMYTNPIPRLAIPSVRMADGPHGLRVQNGGGDNGVTGSEPATAFPTAATLASGWSERNVYRMGEALAREALHYGVDVVLGPGVNIKRNPLAGRNFEYFSEDPLLSGKLGAAAVKGIQSQGVSACVKHFALNNSENFRFVGDSVCDERAMREIYLRSFETVVKEARPHALMCAYNKLRGTFCSENEWLLRNVLREEWGFEGVVMTDWGATHDRVAMLRAGLDLEMPGDTAICRKHIVDGVQDGTLSEAKLDEAAKNVLRLVARHTAKAPQAVDFAAHDALALELALESAVLMKNDGTLPLSAQKPYLVVGELFEKMRYQGAGSSMINPTRLTTPKQAFCKAGIAYTYCKGYREQDFAPDGSLIAQAIEQAEGYDTVLAFVGLTDLAESEGVDRAGMSLPENQLALMRALVATGKRIVVVLFGGSPVELPFAHDVCAILNLYLPGQAGGEAARRLLFGESNPCGKLAETWPIAYADVPYGECFSRTPVELYKESVFVGYRYYRSAQKPVAFPFGYGLSYTTFSYGNMTATLSDGELRVTADITNTGTRAGAEIVQLYVASPCGNARKPDHELRAFSKVTLAAGETVTVALTVRIEDLGAWDCAKGAFTVDSGEYELRLCSNADTVCCRATVRIEGEGVLTEADAVRKAYADLAHVSDEDFAATCACTIPTPAPPTPITIESRLADCQHTRLGRLLYRAVTSMAKRDLRKAKRLPEGAERDNKLKGATFLMRIFESVSLISMTMTAGRRCPYNLAEGLVHLANGKLLRALKSFCSPVKAPKLPSQSKKK